MNVARIAIAFLALLVTFAVAAPASPQSGLDPRSYQRRVAGEPTQILVLGTPHLSGAPENWNPAVLEPLLARLTAFRPDLITIEALSGQSLSKLWQYRQVYGDTAIRYGGRLMMMGASGSAGTGFDMPQAEAEVRRQLLGWPPAPAPAQRRRMAALFATAGDPHSALVQWWRLDPTERRVGDGVNAMLMSQLNEYDRRKNENHLIGSRLAVRLGLERLYAIDEQDDDVFTPEQLADFGKHVFPVIGTEMRAHPRFGAVMDIEQRMNSAEELMAAYRLLNKPSTGRLQADLEWLRVIDRPTVNNVGRIRMAGWEVRNLRMAANIRQAMAGVPGGRVLVVVGAGHKPWLEAYLGMMADVKIVDAEAVLR
ncbi:MAG: DUF5694 domain-containing protein [Pseudomonadota bacterium]|nr:DUF5694 domain-containing protein [Pseudomonadota bacterium]